MPHQAFVYRLLPTPAQETSLCRTLDLCRQVYNSLLHHRKVLYETIGKAPTRYDQVNLLTTWKKQHPELRQVFSQTLQEVANRVDLAFQSFFRRVKEGETPGYPRFKGAGQYDSITYPQSGFALTEEGLQLSKIGTLEVVLHRPLNGKVKTLALRRRQGKWFAIFTCEIQPIPLPPSEEAVGIDVGLHHFATFSNGTRIENPRFFRQDEKALAKAQRKLSRQKRGTPARSKARKVVARIHERIRNRRHNFLHQFARQVVNRYGTIAVEDLNVKNMSRRPKPVKDEETGMCLQNSASRKSGLNKSILDAAWSMFLNLLAQKAEYPLAGDCRSSTRSCESCRYLPGLLLLRQVCQQATLGARTSLPALWACPGP